jgi:hypothetical protein
LQGLTTFVTMHITSRHDTSRSPGGARFEADQRILRRIGRCGIIDPARLAIDSGDGRALGDGSFARFVPWKRSASRCQTIPRENPGGDDSAFACGA